MWHLTLAATRRAKDGEEVVTHLYSLNKFSPVCVGIILATIFTPVSLADKRHYSLPLCLRPPFNLDSIPQPDFLLLYTFFRNVRRGISSPSPSITLFLPHKRKGGKVREASKGGGRRKKRRGGHPSCCFCGSRSACFSPPSHLSSLKGL